MIPHDFTIYTFINQKAMNFNTKDSPLQLNIPRITTGGVSD